MIMHMTEDKTEMTLVLKSSRPMTTEQVIVELEFYINQLAKADDQLKQPTTTIQ